MATWQDIFFNFIATVGGGGVCITTAAWLIKSVISQQLKVEADAEIVRLKSALETQANLAIEGYKSELQIEQLRFSKLQEKRAEIIAELYKRSVDVEILGRTYIHHLGKTPKNEQGETPAMKALSDFDVFVEQHRIYLSERVCELLGEFSKLLKEPVVHAFVYGDIDMPNPPTLTEKQEGFKKAYAAFEKDIPAARRELEHEFRSILGASASQRGSFVRQAKAS